MKNILNSITYLIFMGASISYSQTSFTVKGFHHIESVTCKGKFIYAADIGKELNPTTKDSDGKIYKLDRKGNIIDSTFSKEILHAPKGITIFGEILYIADVDRLVALNCKDGKKLYEIPFTNGVTFLNDISIIDKSSLYISATDKSKIYRVDLKTKTYSEAPIHIPIAGVNGLFYEKKSKRLYVNGIGSDNKANGIVGFVDLLTNKFTRLSTIEGLFDGIWYNQNLIIHQ